MEEISLRAKAKISHFDIVGEAQQRSFEESPQCLWRELRGWSSSELIFLRHFAFAIKEIEKWNFCLRCYRFGNKLRRWPRMSSFSVFGLKFHFRWFQIKYRSHSAAASTSCSSLLRWQLLVPARKIEITFKVWSVYGENQIHSGSTHPSSMTPWCSLYPTPD